MPDRTASDRPWPGVLPSVFPSTRPGSSGYDPGSRVSRSPKDNASLPGTPASSLSECVVGRPFEKPEEARLFMHYVHNLAPWLDICDKRRHFGRDVPKRACRSPLLTCSIIAFSSWCLSLTTGSETANPAKYYSNALQILIPILDGPIEILNEDVLAAIALLRLYEEMQDDDFGAHLTGSSRLLNSLSSLAANGGLGEAASWLALRQDIYICLTRSQPMSISLEGYRDSASLVELDPESMANRAVLSCARVLACAIRPGMDAGLDIETWDALSNDVAHWLSLVSQDDSCYWAEPPAEDRRGISAFPILWMTCPAYIAGYQHIHLAKMLLEIFNPRLSSPGFDTFLKRREADRAIVNNLRLIIGLATSNLAIVNAGFTACHVLQACGMYLTDRREQEGAVEFLRLMRRKTGWRIGHIVDRLQSQWSDDTSSGVLSSLMGS